jgi:uroporphyrinogen-III decarboxylase
LVLRLWRLKEYHLHNHSEGRLEFISSAPAPTHRSRLLKTCHQQPVDRIPDWAFRQARRYQSWYMEIRNRHSLLEIWRSPELAAEVLITAAGQLCVGAAVMFSDLLLPLTPMGLEFGHGVVPESFVKRAIDVVKWVTRFHSNKSK